MDLSRRTAFHERVRLLYQNTHAPRALLARASDRLDPETVSWLQRLVSETESENRRSSAGLFPLSGASHQSMLEANRRLRQIHEQTVEARCGRFDECFPPDAAANWHKDYQFR